MFYFNNRRRLYQKEWCESIIFKSFETYLYMNRAQLSIVYKILFLDKLWQKLIDMSQLRRKTIDQSNNSDKLESPNLDPRQIYQDNLISQRIRLNQIKSFPSNTIFFNQKLISWDLFKQEMDNIWLKIELDLNLFAGFRSINKHKKTKTDMLR